MPESLASLRQTPLEHALCRQVVALRSTLVVDDTRLHPLVDSDPGSDERGANACAGVPLVTSDGEALGALCAIDDAPRVWSLDEIEMLEELAAMVVAQLDVRIAARERQDLDDVLRAVFDQSGAAFVLCTTEGNILRASARFCDALGYDASALRGRNAASLRHPDEITEAIRMRTGLLSGETTEATAIGRARHADGRWIDVVARATIVRDQRACARFLMVSYTLP
ncbi:MAG: PAS domain S-box protein [Deltaproteobacteria bacterium]|nr:PAS domain S-box protein [Nannocystaceae bacterium]